MRLYFLRHGESETNRDDIITGQLDVPLTDKGREQAAEAGRVLQQDGIQIDAIISSQLSRAHETADIVARTIGFPEQHITVQPLVIERHFGSLQGKTKEEAGVLTDEIINKAGAETDQDLRERARQFLEWAHTLHASSVLVVSHNGFGRRLRAVIEDKPSEEIDSFPNGLLVDLGEI